jgi:hypothetical protein
MFLSLLTILLVPDAQAIPEAVPSQVTYEIPVDQGKKKPVTKRKKANQKKRAVKKPSWERWDDFYGSANLETIISRSNVVPKLGAQVDYVVGGRRGKAAGWRSETRVGGAVAVGLLSGSFGKDLHAETLIGPNRGDFVLQFGPRFWWNGYGVPLATDIYLPTSAGLSAVFQARADLDSVVLVGRVTPGIALNENRQRLGVDELSWAIGMDAKRGRLDLHVEYEQRRNAIFKRASVVTCSVATKL